MSVLKQVLDFLNPTKVEEIKDKVGTILFAIVGLITTVVGIYEQVKGALGN